MFQRRGNSGGLPTTMGDTGSGNGGLAGYSSPFAKRTDDGSGRAIKMDAPIVKSWKQASNFTKYSYYILAFFAFLIFFGYRYLRYWNASIWLVCHQQECTLDLTPPGVTTQTLVFPRTQLHSAQKIKTDKAGSFIEVDTSKYEPPARKGKGKNKKTGSYKGPDENGHYRSYTLKFWKKSPEDTERTEDDMEDVDLSVLKQYLEYSEEEEEAGLYLLHMRKFGLSQSRTRIRSMVNKVESYLKRRRQKLVLKESAPLPWQGIVCLIFGLLGIMLTLLIGQFWEEPPKRQGGPGARRSTLRSPKSTKKPSFVVDTGRPSKLPTGYKKY